MDIKSVFIYMGLLTFFLNLEVLTQKPRIFRENYASKPLNLLNIQPKIDLLSKPSTSV